MFNVQDVQTALTNNALVASVDSVPKGHVRIQTGFLYPDGSSIDVFIEQKNDLISNHRPRLTDFGGTWSWLQNLEVKPNRSTTQKMFLNSILDAYRCELQGAAIEHELESIDDLSMGIIRIGQACLRTADMIYSKRLRVQNSFNQDVEDIIVDIAPDYESSTDIQLRSGNVVKVDFKVKGLRLETAVQTLSSGNASSAHTRSIEINARWDDVYDLSDWRERGNQCLTIFDDRTNVYDTHDLKRLERKSILIPFSNTETLTEFLLAA